MIYIRNKGFPIKGYPVKKKAQYVEIIYNTIKEIRKDKIIAIHEFDRELM